MKKILLVFFLSIEIVGFSQQKKGAQKPPTFTITYDKFESKYNYTADAGNIGIYAIGTTNDFKALTFKALTMTVYDSYLTYADGITLLFSDGTKMEIETAEEIGKDAGKGLWRYYVFSYPSEEQWLELKDKTIVSYKFHIFERTYKQGNQLKILVNNFYK